MKVKTFLSLAIIAATAIIFTACNGKSEQQSAQVSSAPSETSPRTSTAATLSSAATRTMPSTLSWKSPLTRKSRKSTPS